MSPSRLDEYRYTLARRKFRLPGALCSTLALRRPIPRALEGKRIIAGRAVPFDLPRSAKGIGRAWRRISRAQALEGFWSKADELHWP